MAELPTPHSIAVGTLISLYSDPDSPLSALNSRCDNDDDDDDDDDRPPSTEDGDDGGSDDDDDDYYGGSRRPRSDAEWRLRLTSLLHQIVVNEDEGYVVLDYSLGGIFDYDDDHDNKDDDDDYLAVGRREDDPLLDYFMVDPIREYDEADERPPGRGEDDVGRGGTSFDDIDRYGPRGVATSLLGRGPRLDRVHAGSLGFCTEGLSTLLDRIDAAFYDGRRDGGGGRGGAGAVRRGRSSPSRALLSALRSASESVDHLMNLLDSWHALLMGTHVGYRPTMSISLDGESAFGVYLRRLCLGMEEIPFESLGRLWDALREFVAEETSSSSSSSSRRRRRDPEDAADGDGAAGDGADPRGWTVIRPSGTSSRDWLPSSPQIERIVRNACLDRDFDAPPLSWGGSRSSRSGPPRAPSSAAFGGRPRRRSRRRRFDERRLYNLLETHPECPSIHFLEFLSSLASGYRTRALESLHRYFDYAMIHERKERAERALMMQASASAAAGSEAGAGAGAGTIATTGVMGTMASGMGGITGGMTGGILNLGHQQQQQQRVGGGGGVGDLKESNVMQYAAILLAQTYYRFGYARLSLQATEEAIRVAQQSGDSECVCFANAWMAFVSSTLGGYSDGGGSAGRNSSVFTKIGGVDGCVGGGVLARNRFFRPLAPMPSTVGGRRRRRDEEEAMLLRCRARASERGLSSLAAHASLELARRLAYRRHVAGSGDGYDALVGNEGESSYECVSSLTWDSIESAGRMPALGSGGSLSTATGHGRIGHLSHHHRGASATMSLLGQPAPTDIYNMIPSEATSILPRQNIAIAGLWESTGHASLASLSSCAAMYGENGGRATVAVERCMPPFSTA
ncbi:hypothetical protein ACHAW5_008526 [Stephanodiscus triporus]|uniref:Anaphase-promoting complex subunit 5 n=1 Tax=Stephanodiscus triporus TaxID=2934178 RepID=A0ABD3NF79_9STRA